MVFPSRTTLGKKTGGVELTASAGKTSDPCQLWMSCSETNVGGVMGSSPV